MPNIVALNTNKAHPRILLKCKIEFAQSNTRITNIFTPKKMSADIEYCNTTNKLTWNALTHEYTNSSKNRSAYKVEHLLNDSFATVESVPGLKTELYPHQKIIVRAMMDLENNSTFKLSYEYADVLYDAAVNAGILSEKVGSGKTFDILALILLQPVPKGPGYDIEYIIHKPFRENKYIEGLVVKKTYGFVLTPTLIFVGASVVVQWTETINKYTTLKLLVVTNVRELEQLIDKVLDKTINSYDIVLIKNGTVSRSVLPKYIPLLSMNQVCSPNIHALLANLRGVCWARVVLDDFDTIRIKENSHTIPAVFTWFVSSTKKIMTATASTKVSCSELSSVENLLVYGNVPISNVADNQLLLWNCNIRCDPQLLDMATTLPRPKFYAYKFKNPNLRLINIMNSLDDDMREIVEMINADAVETAAERLGIKTTTTAGIFEKILGDQFHTLKFTSLMIKFIADQRAKTNERREWTEEDGTYGVRRLEKFEDIDVAYPDIDRFLEEQLTKYTEQKDKCMVTLNRIKEHITEGECPVCCDDMKEDCEGKVLIYKCCSVIICESCTFSTIFKMAHKGTCPNCRTEIDLKQLIYISKDVDLDKLVQEVEDGEVVSDERASADELISPPPQPVPVNYSKFDAIVDIIRGAQPQSQTPIHVHIPQLLTGDAELPEPTTRKVLIFANYDETLYKIRSKLEDEKINYEQLNGTPTQINAMVERFKHTDTNNVLLICAAKYCAGLNLQNASDLVFAHFMMDDNVETQVAGRLIRLGRTTNAKFHYVLYESEYEYMMRTDRMYEL